MLKIDVMRLMVSIVLSNNTTLSVFKQTLSLLNAYLRIQFLGAVISIHHLSNKTLINLSVLVKNCHCIGKLQPQLLKFGLKIWSIEQDVILKWTLGPSVTCSESTMCLCVKSYLLKGKMKKRNFGCSMWMKTPLMSTKKTRTAAMCPLFLMRLVKCHLIRMNTCLWGLIITLSSLISLLTPNATTLLPKLITKVHLLISGLRSLRL